MPKFKEQLTATIARAKETALRIASRVIPSRQVELSEVNRPVLRGVIAGAIAFGLVSGAVYPIGRQRTELSAQIPWTRPASEDVTQPPAPVDVVKTPAPPPSPPAAPPPAPPLRTVAPEPEVRSPARPGEPMATAPEHQAPDKACPEVSIPAGVELYLAVDHEALRVTITWTDPSSKAVQKIHLPLDADPSTCHDPRVSAVLAMAQRQKDRFYR